MQKLVTILLATLVCALCWLPLELAHSQAPSIPGYAVPGTNGNSQVFLPVGAFRFLNITTDATTVVKSGAGVFHTLTLNNATTATETITIYDNTAASGTKIASITVPSSPQPVTLRYDVVFSNGLTIVTGVAAGDLTVSYQ